MGVMPLPKFRTLYFPSGVLTKEGVGITLKPNDDITLAALGRFHLTAIDLTDQERAEKINRLEKKERIKMGFSLVKRSELPVAAKGKEAATSPKVGISEGGRIVFNSFVNKSWKDVVKIAVLFDPEAKKVLFAGLKKDEKFAVKGYDDKDAFVPTISKPNEKGKGGGDYALSASAFLKKADYDYATTGNQVYDMVYNEKLKGYILTLPETLPARRPVTPRKPKPAATPEAAKVATAPNGAVAPAATAPEAPKDEELVLE